MGNQAGLALQPPPVLGCSENSRLCRGSGSCARGAHRAQSGELGALEADVDVTSSIVKSPADTPAAIAACANVEQTLLLNNEVALDADSRVKDSSEVEFVSGSITILNHERGCRRHECRRLLVTHTMEMRPSSALQLIIENSGDIANFYDFNAAVLGKGAFGVVRKGVLKVTGAVRAVKSISKAQMKTSVPTLKKEIEIMKAIDHPNLLMLNEIFEDDKALHLVLELCEGGDLQGRLAKAGTFSEMQAASAMQQIIRAVFYLHNNQIVHRDLKAANCLLATSALIGQARLKVSDFGLSCRLQPDQVLVQTVGTPTHLSPEVLAKKYRSECDIWSCGVIVYELLSGRLPFSGETRQDLYKQINRGYVNFGLTQWLDISQTAVSFVGALLARDPQVRCNASAALSHQWLVDHLPSTDDTEHLPMTIIDDLRKFRRRNKLKRAALHVLASMVPEEEIARARQAFISLDMNGDGLFSVSELEAKLRNHQKKKNPGKAAPAKTASSGASTEKIFEEDFSYTEFLAATFDRQNAITKDGLCRAAFGSFDKNGDGQVSVSELRTGRLLGQLTEDEIASALAEIDADGDAMMDYEEFMRMMRASSMLSEWRPR